MEIFRKKLLLKGYYYDSKIIVYLKLKSELKFITKFKIKLSFIKYI